MVFQGNWTVKKKKIGLDVNWSLTQIYVVLWVFFYRNTSILQASHITGILYSLGFYYRYNGVPG